MIDSGNIFAHCLVNFLAIKLIATSNIKHLKGKYVIGIQSSINLNTGSYFCTFFGKV